MIANVKMCQNYHRDVILLMVSSFKDAIDLTRYAEP